MAIPPALENLTHRIVDARDREAVKQGRLPFWVKKYLIGTDGRGRVCEAEFRAYRLIPNKEDRDIRLEKRAIANGKTVMVQTIHANVGELEDILREFKRTANGG